MADEAAFVTPGLSVSVAQEANFSSGGTSVKQDGGALLRTSQALYGADNRLINGHHMFLIAQQ
jgi:hypothetical protein